MNIDELLRHTVERGASDLHLKVGNVPFLRVDGDLQPAPFAELTSEDAAAFALAVMSEHKRQEFETTNEADIGYTLQVYAESEPGAATDAAQPRPKKRQRSGKA